MGGEEATYKACCYKLNVNMSQGTTGLCVCLCLRRSARLIICLIFFVCVCVFRGLAGVRFCVCLINEEGQQRLSAVLAPQLASLYHSNST